MIIKQAASCSSKTQEITGRDIKPGRRHTRLPDSVSRSVQQNLYKPVHIAHFSFHVFVRVSELGVAATESNMFAVLSPFFRAIVVHCYYLRVVPHPIVVKSIEYDRKTFPLISHSKNIAFLFYFPSIPQCHPISAKLTSPTYPEFHL